MLTYDDLTNKKFELEKLLPLPNDVLNKIKRKIYLELTSSSDNFENGDLTQRETEMILFEDKVVPDHSLREHIQILNIAYAFETIVNMAKKIDKPIDDNDVRKIHKIIVRGLDDLNGGVYRGEGLKFPYSDIDMPSPVKVQRMMDDFGMWLFTARTLHPVALAAEDHLKLMTIQPFNKGNGSVARMLMNLILLKNGFPPALFSRREKKEYWEVLRKAVYSTKVSERADYDKLICRVVNRGLDLYIKMATKGDADYEPESVYFLRIGQLAKKSGERVSTLRYWTNLGLIEPAGKTSSDYLIYSSEVLEKIEKINMLKNQRLTLTEIKETLTKE
ncbi:MAG: MerR family transcriptional regulator [Alphaproteobacteria bacterium]|nr:MerR family transcriptional regulator [Alphaproteobacteria bacterium]